MTTPTKSSDASSHTASSTEGSATTGAEANNVVEMSSAQPDAEASSAPTPSNSSTKQPDEKSSNKMTVLIGVLLFLSVGLNFWQSQNQANLETRAGETSVALERAIERIDLETLRANRAETTISAIDQGVDKVNDRIVELQAALAELSDLTER